MTIVTRQTRLIDPVTKEYPLYISSIKDATGTIFADTMTEEDMLGYGYEVVHDTPVPTGDIVNELPPVLTDGNWYRAWEVREFNEGEKARQLANAKAVNKERADYLLETSFNKGFPYMYNEQLVHIQISPTDRQNITALRTIAKEAIAESQDITFKFRVYENINILLTPAQMVDVGNQAFARVSEGYATIWDIKDNTDLAETEAAIPAIPNELFTL